jgi:glycosyltransferase involved in cell wall biosynthesis
MVSVIIPYLQEPYLDRTIKSVGDNAVGEFEILAIEGSAGMRPAINEGLQKAQGDWIMKLDAHCILCPKWDKIIEDCKENWLMIPRRYSLHEATWSRDDSKRPRDYHYLAYPDRKNTGYGYSLIVQDWYKNRRGPVIDDAMTFQGSCWIANKQYFMEHVGYMDDRPETYGTWAQDQQEIGLKYWLNGGEVKVNKNYWYAHLQKRGYHYKLGKFSHRYKKNASVIKGNEWGTKHWMDDEEPNMLHKFEWYVEKFWPIPDWPTDWRTAWKKP